MERRIHLSILNDAVSFLGEWGEFTGTFPFRREKKKKTLQLGGEMSESVECVDFVFFCVLKKTVSTSCSEIIT